MLKKHSSHLLGIFDLIFIAFFIFIAVAISASEDKQIDKASNTEDKLSMTQEKADKIIDIFNNSMKAPLAPMNAFIEDIISFDNKANCPSPKLVEVSLPLDKNDPIKCKITEVEEDISREEKDIFFQCDFFIPEYESESDGNNCPLKNPNYTLVLDDETIKCDLENQRTLRGRTDLRFYCHYLLDKSQ